MCSGFCDTYSWSHIELRRRVEVSATGQSKEIGGALGVKLSRAYIIESRVATSEATPATTVVPHANLEPVPEAILEMARQYVKDAKIPASRHGGSGFWAKGFQAARYSKMW
jgi:hypothetical protein